MTRHLLCIAMLALASCGDGDDENTDDGDDGGGTDETSSPYCDDFDTALGESDEALGMTSAAFLDLIPAAGTTSVSWSQGEDGSADFVVAVAVDTLRLVQSTEVYPETEGPTNAIGVYCPDYIAVDAVVELTSPDGRLNERMSVLLVLDEDNVGSGTLSFSAALDPDALGGTLDLNDFLTISDYDSVSLSLWASFQDHALAGTLNVQGEGTSGDVAFAENTEIAVLGGSDGE